VYTVNDFFCGAGGMGLGFKQAGYEILGAWDFDKYAVETYRHNVGDHVEQADVSEMTWQDLPVADVWTFGFPCQDLSYAGNRAGIFEGKRSGLFFEIMRLLEEIEEVRGMDSLPKIIMAENVKGLKNYLPVLEEEYNKRGYKMYYKLLNSKFWGVPQNRERYFVVGLRKDIEGDFEFPVQQEDFVPRLSSILEDEVEERFYLTGERADKVIAEALERLQIKETKGCSLRTRSYRGQPQKLEIRKDLVANTITSVEKDSMILEKQPELTKLAGLWGMNKQAGSVWDKEGVSPTLKTPSGGYSEPLIVVDQPQINIIGTMKNEWAQGTNSRYWVHDQEGLVGAVAASDYKDPKRILNTEFRIRKLIPREYARLQGFGDDFEQVVSNTQFYKQMGNAVTVNVAQALAEQVKKWL
jgi:DNA (cytosine-5)-methyltransferase 1